MKKILILLLILALSLTALVGCDVLANLGIGQQPDTGDETPEVDADLQGAYDYVHQLTKTIAEKTGANYTLVGAVVRGDKVFNVQWTVTDERVVLTTSEDGKTITVTVPEPVEDIPYDLTFTIYNEKGESLSRTYKHVVPKFAYTSFAEYAAAEKGTAVVVTGIVTGVISKTTGSSAYGIYLQDLNNEGGYYVWNLTEDPHGVIEVGMTVKVKGNKDLYNGTYEVVSPSVEIIDSTIKAVEPVDFTDLYLAAPSLDHTTLVGKQGMLVTVKGVTILEAGDNGYYYFQLGELKTYLRISSSNNPTTKEALDTIKSVHGANYGNTADVTGIISIYNGNFYLSPVGADAFSNIKVPERTDAEKVAFELDALKFDASFSTDKVIDLVLGGETYENVVISWTSNNDAIVIADGKATITVPDSELIVKLTATATLGNETASKEFSVKLSKTLTTIPDATEIGVANPSYTTDKYMIAGIITSLYGKEDSALKYGNVIITDENGNSIIVYGLYNADGSIRYDAMEVKPAVGDYIVVLGTLGAYNGTAQMKNGWVLTHTVETSIPAASEIGVANPNYTADKYMVTGVISALYGKEDSAVKYGNVIIKDADGNEFIIYGMYSSTGASRYDAMTYKPVVGDTITVLGTLGSYNGTAQMKNGWLIACEKGATTPDDGGETPDDGGETPAPEDNVLASDKIFAEIPVEAEGTYPSYGNYNGTYTYNGMTITTVDVLRNSHGVPYVFQFKKTTGAFTISNVTANSVTIVLVTSYDTFSTPVITLGDVELTYDSATVLATKEETGTNNSSGYAVSRYTITITLTDAATGDLAIKNTSGYAMYLESIAFNGSAAGGTVTPDPDPTPTITTSAPITDVAQLTDGTKIVIAGSTTDVALGAQSGTLRTKIDITRNSDGSLTYAEDAGVSVLTLELNADGTWAIKDGNVYLVAVEGGNKVDVTEDKTNPLAKWTIEFVDGVLKIHTNDGANERFLQYNASSPRFVAYKASSNQQDVVICTVA